MKHAMYLCLCILFIQSNAFAGGSLGHLGSFEKWSKVEITLTGPDSDGNAGANPNPFLIEVGVTFTHNSETYIVPAFFNGDDNGNQVGNVWKVRFSPNQTGDWTFSTQSDDAQLNGYTGTFTVIDPPAGAPDFYKYGWLKATNTHYLKFAEGPYFLKGGADDPEDFLSTTTNNVEGFCNPCWPDAWLTWSGKRAAVDYLASKEVNSMYIMTYNLGPLADGKNVFPWVSKTDITYFDVAKLKEWEDLFTYMQERNIVLHIVLEDDSDNKNFDHALYYRELIARFGHFNALTWNMSEEYNENYTSTEIKNFAQIITDLDAYGHPIGVHNQAQLTHLDPFLADDRFDYLSIQTALETQNGNAVTYFNKTLSRPMALWFDETGKISSSDRTLSRNIVWSVYMGGAQFELHTWNAGTGVADGFAAWGGHWDDMRLARQFMETLPFWEMAPANNLLSPTAGNYGFAKPGQIYAGYLQNGGPVSLDLSAYTGQFEVQWYNTTTGTYSSITQIAGGSVVNLGSSPYPGDAAFMVRYVGTADPVAVIASPQDNDKFATNVAISFSAAGSHDPDGGSILAYSWNFGDGETSMAANPSHAYSNEGIVTVNLSVQDDEGVWSPDTTISLNISNQNDAPNAPDDLVQTIQETSVAVTLNMTDPDGPGPYVYEVLSNPANGQLSGTAPDLVYTPNSAFIGQDSFTWKVNDGLADSRTATFVIQVNANQPPVAQSFSLSMFKNTTLDISLATRFDDPDDGPGPYTFSIAQDPAHGTLVQVSNDLSYTPDPDYSGKDYIMWQVHDGIDISNAGTIEISVNTQITVTPDVTGSPNPYTLGTAAIGQRFYTDRGYTISTLPQALTDTILIKTPNDDKNLTLPLVFTVDVNVPVTVYVAVDSRGDAGMDWLASYTNSGLTIESVIYGVTYSYNVYRKSIGAGVEPFGGNKNGGNIAAKANYFVLIAEPDVTPPSDVVNLKASPSGTDITLSWDAATDLESGIKGYDIYRGLTADSIKYLTTVGNVESYPDSTGTAYTEFFYQVKALNNAGLESQNFSNIASALTGELTIPFEMSNLHRVSTSSPYAIDVLTVGGKFYTDRPYIIEAVPPELNNQIMIKTANNDKSLTAPEVVTVDVNMPATIYVAVDSRGDASMDWLASYTNSGLTIKTDVLVYNVYKKSVAAGTVSFGGNKNGGNDEAKANYFVIAAPFP